jgi:hypothetical protein
MHEMNSWAAAATEAKEVRSRWRAWRFAVGWDWRIVEIALVALECERVPR